MSEETNPDEKKFWFPAKRYGWGWGLPNCWQGWVVVLVYIALLIGGSFLLLPNKHAALFIGYIISLSTVLTIICWLKGEKPGWRWGGK